MQEREKLNKFVEIWEPYLCKICQIRICHALDKLGVIGKTKTFVSPRLKTRFAKKNLCENCYTRIQQKLQGK